MFYLENLVFVLIVVMDGIIKVSLLDIMEEIYRFVEVVIKWNVLMNINK